MASSLGGLHAFIGRHEAVEALTRRTEDARAGRGGVTFLIGEVGVGKSTLAAEIVGRARERGIQVLTGRAPALEEPPPFFLIRQALESVPKESRRAGTSRPEEALLAYVPPSPGEGVLLGFAPNLDGDPSSAPVQVETRLLEALGEVSERSEMNRERLLLSLTDQFLRLTSRGPTLLVLEDLHLADESSLGCVEYLATQLERQPLWILASSRPYASLPEDRRERLEKLERSMRAERIVLPPFTSTEIGEFLRLVEPERTPTPEQIARWHSETGGNPLFLAQILRMQREGADPGIPPEVAHGQKLSEFLAQTLPQLDAEEQRVVAVAAVLGQEFRFGLLLSASDEEEERLAEVIDRLVAHGVLLEHPDEVLAFVSDDVRQRIYSNLTETRRRLLHRNVGEAIESSASADLAVVYELARHYYLGKVDEKALHYNRMAAEFAIRTYSSVIAREHLERALEAHTRAFPKDRSGRVELTVDLAIQLDNLGELKRAETLLRGLAKHRAAPETYTDGQELLVQLYLARVLTDRGEWKAAEETSQKLLERVSESTDPLPRIHLYRLHGESLYYLGRYPEALAMHDQALALAQHLANPREVALEEVRRGTVLAMMLDRAEEAKEFVRKGARALEELGDNREASFAHLFLGTTLAGQNDLEAAGAEFRVAVDLGEKAHDLRRVAWSRFNLADVHRAQRRFPEALEENRRARQIVERIGDRFGLVQTMIIQGKIHLDTNQLGPAEVELLEALRLVRELKAPADEVDVVLRLAQLAYARNDPETARTRVDELDRLELARLRPDIAPEFLDLKAALGPEDRPGLRG